MNIHKRLVTVAMTGALAGGGLIGTTGASAATQGEFTAQSCYGDAKDYSKATGTHIYPNYPTFFYLKATSSCADINIKTDTNRYVKVCFQADDPNDDYCQASYKLTTAGEWKTIATNVKDGTRFHFYFRSDARSTGKYAA